MAEQRALFAFIHGDFGDGQGTWGDVVAALGKERPTLVIERPGNDRLRLDRERHTFASDAAAAIDDLERAGSTQIHLVGHSYGALVAIEVATRRPGWIRSLHLIEPPYFALLPEDDAAQAMNRAARQIQADYPLLGDDRSTAAFFTMIDLQRAVDRLRGTPEWERLAAYASRFARSEPAGDFPAAALELLPEGMPVALYSGGRSHPALRAILQALASRLSDAEVIEIETANHAVQRSGAPFVSKMLETADRADRAAHGRPLASGSGATGK